MGGKRPPSTINIEASHQYDSMPLFFKSVGRWTLWDCPSFDGGDGFYGIEHRLMAEMDFMGLPIV